MTESVSIALLPVPHLPNIEQSCSLDSQILSSAAVEVVGGAVVGFLSRSCLHFPHRFRSWFPLAGSLAGAVKTFPKFVQWHQRCSEISSVNHDLEQLFANCLGINENALECHVSTRSCLVKKTALKDNLETMLLTEDVAERVLPLSKNWIEERERLTKLTSSQAVIKIDRVDTFPERELIPIRKEDLVEGFSVGIKSGLTVGAVASVGILTLGVIMLPLHLMQTVVKNGGPAAFKRLFSEMGSFCLLSVVLTSFSMIGGGALGSAFTWGRRKFEQIEKEDVDERLSILAANQTGTTLERVQCDSTAGRCFLLKSVGRLKDKEFTVIGPLATRASNRRFK